MYSVYFFCLAVALTAIEYFRKWGQLNFMLGVVIALKYLLFCNVGLMGLLGFYGHTFIADEIARKIGWPIGNPFQFEVAVANLSYGVLGVMCLRFRGLFWMATAIGNAIFLYGAAYGHIVQSTQGDFEPYNVGAVLWIGDILIPSIYICLLFLYLLDRRDILGKKRD